MDPKNWILRDPPGALSQRLISYGAACAPSASRITMSPRQVFCPSFVQVTPPSVQVEEQALSQFGGVAPSVQVAPGVLLPQTVARKMLFFVLWPMGYT